MNGQLHIVRGVVTTAKEQMHSVRVDKKTGYGTISSTPEVLFLDASGKEHRYRGDMFESAQPGHDVVVIANCASGKPMAFANFTTEIVHDAKELTYSTTLAANLSGTLIAALVLALPGLFIWGLIMETIDLGDRAFTAGGLQVFLVLLVVCVYAGVTIYAKSYRERTDALKAKIDRLLLAEREQNNGTGKSPSTK